MVIAEQVWHSENAALGWVFFVGFFCLVFIFFFFFSLIFVHQAVFYMVHASLLQAAE